MEYQNHFIFKPYRVLIAKHTAEMLKSKISAGVTFCATIALSLYRHMYATSNHQKQNQGRGSKSDLSQLMTREKKQCRRKLAKKTTGASEAFHTQQAQGVVLKLLPCYWQEGHDYDNLQVAL